MLSGWLANGGNDRGMGFPGLCPSPGSSLTVCTPRQGLSYSGCQVPQRSKDGL